MDDRPRVETRSRAAWRAWLETHHASSPGAWVIYRRKAAAEPGDPTYDDVVEEALCFGWVDSRPGAVDEARTSLYFSPRKPGSGWADTNKARVEALAAAGLMAPAGRAVVDRARADGSWDRIAMSEAALEPDDLVAAFERFPGSRANWDAFPRGARRAILQWIEQAKRAETRTARIDETASLAAQGIRANQWTPRGSREGAAEAGASADGTADGDG
jgi:uncharacterized protein YdeI (YjbR/CyaY-like superfamily)